MVAPLYALYECGYRHSFDEGRDPPDQCPDCMSGCDREGIYVDKPSTMGGTIS